MITSRDPEHLFDMYCWNPGCHRYCQPRKRRGSLLMPLYDAHTYGPPVGTECPECNALLHAELDPDRNELHPFHFRAWIGTQPDNIEDWDSSAVEALQAFATWFRLHEGHFKGKFHSTRQRLDKTVIAFGVKGGYE